ncbi:hypothetical protein ACHQM5_008247 [Ranunculus cassubicifolius]
MSQTMLNSDRRKELVSFDDTKSGVKGLMDNGVTKIPEIFIHPPEYQKLPLTPCQRKIPIIDLQNVATSRGNIVEQIRSASISGGFFQLVNHGIPINVLDEMLAGIRKFNEQPVEIKSEYYNRDYDTKKVVYNSNFDLFSSPAANWRDSFYCSMAPNFPDPEELPAVCRDILMDFSKRIQVLGNNLVELLSEALGLSTNHLKDMGCAEGVSVICHYYPPCPEPDLTLGNTKHSDSSFFTVLLQDHIGGLQVILEDQWVDVTPIHGALVVNIGDFLQLVSNDIFKSSEHRVQAKKEGPRISAACFFRTDLRTSSMKLYGPIKELITKVNPPRYRETTIEELIAFYYKKGLDGNSDLTPFKLSA